MTEILLATGLQKPFTGVNPFYAARGKALHKAIELDHLGTLDVDSLHEAVIPGFKAYVDFCAKERVSPLHSELALTSEAEGLGFQGHLDMVALIGGATALMDFKYTKQVDLESTRYQLAAYHLLWSLTQPMPLNRVLVLQLSPDPEAKSPYRVHEIPPGVLKEAEDVFLAALLVYHHQRVRVAE